MAYFLTLLFLFSLTCLSAKDYGTCGKTFPIQERNLLDYLQERLLSASPKEMELFTKKQTQLLLEPKSLNLPYAKRYRSFNYDPTITVKEDIIDHEGTVIVKKGTKYNPLNDCSLNKELLFFDATQKEHLAWAKSKKGTWILVGGNPLELEEKEGRPIYFDQFGYLTKKFGIKAIPAQVSGEGKHLKIEEFVLEVS